MSPRFKSKPVLIEAFQWWKNGDHPNDGVGEEILSQLEPGKTFTRLEGAVVGFYRHPDYPGSEFCDDCGNSYHRHGFLDTAQGGHKVCPGDWIIPEMGRPGRYYPCKPDVMLARWELIDEKPLNAIVKLWSIPAGTRAEKCEKCPATIYKVPSGVNPHKVMPLAVAPELETKQGIVATLAKSPTAQEEGYGYSHFSDCPEAAAFRKRKPVPESIERSGFIGLTLFGFILAVVYGSMALVFAFALWGSIIEQKTKNACLERGYPNSTVAWPSATRYCIKRVDQTDSVVLLRNLKR